MADESQRINQDEIEQLLQQAARAAGAPASAAKPAPASSPSPQPAAGSPGGPAFDKLLGQDDVEALFQQAVAPGPQKPAPGQTPRSSSAAAFGRDEGVAPADVELLLQQAERAIASLDEASPEPPGVTPFSLEDFVGAPPNSERATLDLIRDVELDLKIEFGRTHMYLEDVLKLRKGSVVPLDKLAGDPVDIFVNGRLIAKGEVLVLNDNFCVRVAELIAGETTG